jgi:hypothetical protein
MDELKRLFEERKWLVYTAGGVLALFLCFWGYRVVFGGSESLMTTDSLAEELSVKFSDTGESVTMARGDVVRQLLERPGSTPLPPETRVGHPKTGKQTGMVGSESSWKKFLDQINVERSYKGKPVERK